MKRQLNSLGIDKDPKETTVVVQCLVGGFIYSSSFDETTRL